MTFYTRCATCGKKIELGFNCPNCGAKFHSDYLDGFPPDEEVTDDQFLELDTSQIENLPKLLEDYQRKARIFLEHGTPENRSAMQQIEMTLAGWVAPLLHDYKLLYEAPKIFMDYHIQSHSGEHVTISVNNDDLKRAQALKTDDPCRDWGDCS